MQEDLLYVVGSSSEVTDIHNADREMYPLYHQAEYLAFTLSPGQALYIPALWLHSVLAEDFSISVNVFWRDLPTEAYPRKDLLWEQRPSGRSRSRHKNRRGDCRASEAAKHFRDFYGNRCIRQLQIGLA